MGLFEFIKNIFGFKKKKKPFTRNFNVKEFDCKDGTPYPDAWVEDRLNPLCISLEVIREYFGNKPITITSGYRTPEYNSNVVHGAIRSQHMYGRAADIKIKGVHARIVARGIRKLIREKRILNGGVGSYTSFTHYDIRGNNAYWKR